MHEVMTAAHTRLDALARGEREVVPAPACVMAATRELVEREDTVSTFLRTKLEQTGNGPDRLTLRAALTEYREMCHGGKAPESAEVFRVAMMNALGSFSPTYRGKRDNWRGWRLRVVEEEASDDDVA